MEVSLGHAQPYPERRLTWRLVMITLTPSQSMVGAPGDSLNGICGVCNLGFELYFTRSSDSL